MSDGFYLSVLIGFPQCWFCWSVDAIMKLSPLLIGSEHEAIATLQDALAFVDAFEAETVNHTVCQRRDLGRLDQVP